MNDEENLQALKALNIMKKYMESDDGTRFEGLTPRDAKKLIELGVMDPFDQGNRDFNHSYFIELAKFIPGIRFMGDVYTGSGGLLFPEVRIDGFHAPAILRRANLPVLLALGPNEVTRERNLVRVWWD